MTCTCSHTEEKHTADKLLVLHAKGEDKLLVLHTKSLCQQALSVGVSAVSARAAQAGSRECFTKGKKNQCYTESTLLVPGSKRA